MKRQAPKTSMLLLIFAGIAVLSGAILYATLPREKTFTTSVFLYPDTAQLWIDQVYSTDKLKAFATESGLDLNSLELSFPKSRRTNHIVSPKVEDRISAALVDNTNTRFRKFDSHMKVEIEHTNLGAVEQFIVPYFNFLQTSYLSTWIATFETTSADIVGNREEALQANVFGAPISQYVQMQVKSKILGGSAIAGAPATVKNLTFGLALIIPLALLIALAFTAMLFLAIRYFDVLLNGFPTVPSQQYGYDEKSRRPLGDPAE